MDGDLYQRSAPVVVDRAMGVNGELALRRQGDQFEIISNGTFLMDTRGGASERLLIQAALAGATVPSRVLIGGLGVGFSLAEAVRRPATAVAAVTVVEVEPAVIGWHRTHLRPFSASALDDRRVRVECADLAAWLRDGHDRFDAVCLDTDNGPDWTVTDSNARLYDDAGLEAIRRRLAPGGVLAVWSAGESAAYERRLRRVFTDVGLHRVPVARGEPDVIYLARG